MMTDEWIWFWFRYLKLNNNYKQYCEAKRNNDKKITSKLEKKFKKIAQLYIDWGDIHAFSERAANRKYWYEWLESHRHLFINEDNRKAVTMRKPVSELDGQYIYLKLPIRKSAPITTKEAKQLIYKEFEKKQIKAAADRGMVKYQLAAKNISGRTLRGLRKALNVWHLYNPADGAERTAKGVAILLAEGAKNKKVNGVSDWGWTMDQVNYDDLDDMRTQIMRYNREANNMIANTIKGQFPVKK